MDTQKQPKRIQRKRTKGWKMPENTIYVGRPSKWGNVFNWQDERPWREDSSYTRKMMARDSYERWLDGVYPDIEPEKRQWILDHIEELQGKNLACFCKEDEPCHADVLLELANKKEEQRKNER